MSVPPTRLSRVSLGFHSDQSAPTGDTGPWLSVGTNVGAGIDEVSTTTASVDFGSINPQEASTQTVAISRATRGDTIIANPDSEWSGDDYHLSVMAHSGDTTGEVTVKATNSAATAHDPAATVWRFTRIGFGNPLL